MPSPLRPVTRCRNNRVGRRCLLAKVGELLHVVTGGNWHFHGLLLVLVLVLLVLLVLVVLLLLVLHI